MLILSGPTIIVMRILMPDGAITLEMLKTLLIQDSFHQGPFFRGQPGGSDVAYLRDGIAWYFKDFMTPEELGGKRLVLDFDGVRTQMELWINGVKTGEHVYGYTPFKIDITSYLKSERETNTIAVKTVNPGENSRWFAGAGIYRPVYISMLNPVAIECRVELLSPEGKFTSLAPVSMILSGESQSRIDLSCLIENPRFWGVNHPELYRALVSLYCNGRETDSYESKFGIRSITYNAEQGFLLNGEEILMKGGCMYHDNGLLGAAAFPDAEYRRVKIMKENGLPGRVWHCEFLLSK